MTEPLTVRPVAGPAEEAAFLDLPARLAPDWTVPLRFEQRLLFDLARNGFLQDHAVARFVAWQGAAPLGRIAACVPRNGPGEASFGFLCCTPDAAVLAALLAAARGWCAGEGRAGMLGPLSFTINHEVGAQIGFPGRAPMLRMPRTPAWLPAMLEGAGLLPVQDVLACTLDLAAERHRARFAALAARRPAEAARVAIRPLDRRRYAAEIRAVAALYNAAWAANWGAVPLGAAEVATLGQLLRPLLWRGEVFFADWDGVPAGLLSLVPNIEGALPADGRLLPLGWARLGLAMAGRVDSARMPMLGLLPEFRGRPEGALLLGALLDRAIGLAERRGWRQVEISWILEHNAAMLNAMARLPAPVTGRWRLWRDGTAPAAAQQAAG